MELIQREFWFFRMMIDLQYNNDVKLQKIRPGIDRKRAFLRVKKNIYSRDTSDLYRQD